MDTLGRLFDRNAHIYGNEEALVFAGKHLTYGELRRRAGRLTAALFRLGARRQDRVSILAMNCPNMSKFTAPATWPAISSER